MSNIQKSFKNKVKYGLRMASGGFLSTVPDASPTSMFSGPDGSVGQSYSGASSPMMPNQRPSGLGAAGGGLRLAAGSLQQSAQPTSALSKLDNQIGIGNAIDNSTMTMSEKQALGLGTTSADASTLRNQTSALSSLRDGIAKQAQAFADGGVIGIIRNRGKQLDKIETDAVNGTPPPQGKVEAPAAPVDDTDAAIQVDRARLAAQRAAQPKKKFLGLFADGGVVGTLRNRGAQIDAAVDGAVNGTPEPPQKVTTTPPPSDIDADMAARIAANQAAARAIKPKKNMFGFAKSGVVQGEGTRTSDSVPAVVGEGDEKQKLALSKGEGLLVVSNNTMDNPQAMDQIRQILADSNGGKEPKMPDQGLRAGVQRAAGSAVFAPTDDALAADSLSTAAMNATLGTQVAPATPDPKSNKTILRQAQYSPPEPVAQNLLDAPQYNSSSPEAVAAAKSAQLDPGFTPDVNQSRTLRSGYVSNMADDPNVVRGTSTVDATAMKAPEGGGYITGQPGAGGLRRSIAVQPSATRWEDGQQYKDAIAQNEKDKVTLRGMQRDRIKRTAQMPGATQGDLIALADQQKDDVLQNDKLKMLNDNQFRREDLSLRRDQARITAQNMDADNERANRTQQDLEAERVSSHLDKLLDNYAPTAGLKDEELSAAQTKRARIQQAMMETYGGKLPKNLQEFQKDAVKRLHQARLTEALNAAMANRGVIDKARNVFSGNVMPTIGTDPNRSITKQDGRTIYHAGVPLFANDVFQGDNDLISAYEERLAEQNKSKSSR